MSYLDTVMAVAPTALGAGAGYALTGGNPTGAFMGASVGSSLSNYFFQDRNLDYQKGLQNKIFAREDNSIRRRVEDLRAAGLSPVLAAGQGANAGAVINTKAQQIDEQMALNLLRMKTDIEMSNVQKELIKQQIDYQKANSAIKWHDYKIYNKTGTTSNMSGIGNDLRNIFGVSQSPIIKDLKDNINKKLTEAKEVFKPVIKPSKIVEPKGGFKQKPDWMNKADWEFYNENRR